MTQGAALFGIGAADPLQRVRARQPSARAEE
jgi:hypothetical protein